MSNRSQIAPGTSLNWGMYRVSFTKRLAQRYVLLRFAYAMLTSMTCRVRYLMHHFRFESGVSVIYCLVVNPTPFVCSSVRPSYRAGFHTFKINCSSDWQQTRWIHSLRDPACIVNVLTLRNKHVYRQSQGVKFWTSWLQSPHGPRQFLYIRYLTTNTFCKDSYHIDRIAHWLLKD